MPPLRSRMQQRFTAVYKTARQSPIIAPSFLEPRDAGRRRSDASTERKPTRPRQPIVHRRLSSTAVEVPTPDRFPEAPAIAAISVPAQPATSKVRRALTPRAPPATPRVAQLISPRALKRRRAPARVTIRSSAASHQPAAAVKPSPPSSPVPGLQPVFTAVSAAAPPTPTSPVPGSQPVFSLSDEEEPPPRRAPDPGLTFFPDQERGNTTAPQGATKLPQTPAPPSAQPPIKRGSTTASDGSQQQPCS
ncbi:vegetative cell wall protein gp1-like [Ooceraea biroi]|uniref:vegetative cell wall protein gp1-like n=1 Tax=Ooceraea biroi TaxID=2015173 RepID=UPI000F096D40|nr:vegetative cell wall protein gp1-like [Ooceraea biroi]